jgi:hypothetical protein
MGSTAGIVVHCGPLEALSLLARGRTMSMSTKGCLWWFDGWFGGDGFVTGFGKYYADAAKSGNPSSYLAFNGGASTFTRRTDVQDYTAGEATNMTDKTCMGRLQDTIQCHIFTPMATGWAGGPLKYTEMQILDYTNQQVTLDAGITWNLGVSAGGVISQHFIDTFQHIRSAIRSRP